MDYDLHRVVQSFPAESGIFDVVIVDEASQCDMKSLPVLFRAKKVLVVGDPEQISPVSVGIDRSKVFELIRQFLSDISNADTTFLIDNSLYDISKTIPRMGRILLTEHFRCVPPIIEFNNYLCPSYAGKLEPLRQPNPQERLDPSINNIFMENGFKDNSDVNKPEAEALVEMLIKCCKDEQYSRGGKNNRKRTMGVISLLGEKQAKYISELIAQRIDETEREERRIICGDAYAFQGDERDVMFLSLVVATNEQYRALTIDSDRQRFNVATSRARDQVFLFHSVRLNDIKNPECVRYKLLSWYMNPPLAEIEAGMEILKQKAESPFEIDVGERIINRGYRVIPQFRPLPNDYNYRIDLVIQGENNRVAVECDGDRSHGIERWEYDQRREAQLRRAGWKFWRINGSAFYRNKEKALESLWQFLEEEGVKPLIYKKTTENSSKTSEKNSKIPKDNQNNRDSHYNNESVVTQKNDKVLSENTDKVSPVTLQENLFNITEPQPVPNNWEIWFEISHWGKETGHIESSERAFAYQIGKKLKHSYEIYPNQKSKMEKLWKIAIKKGFKPK
ncbi:MAG: DUF559 domain-containing protein [Nitrospinae bacterium]|nr:DUF559 domain-containing protein [Nitrospinota bacterium]